MTTDHSSDDPAIADPSLREAWHRIAEHPGFRANAEWMALRRMHGILTGNCRELLALISRPNREPEFALELVQNVRESPIQEEFDLELDRLLHNLVAAVYSLVEHTQRVVKRYDDGDFLRQYRDRLEKVKSSPYSFFLKDLRRYVQHYKLPSVTQEVSFGQNYFKAKLAFHVPELLEWNDWSASAKVLLRGSGQDLPVEEPITRYIRDVNELYFWFFGQFGRLHSDEIDGLNELVDDYNRILTGEPR